MKQRIWILPIFSLVIIVVFMLGMGVVYFYNQSTLQKFQHINSVYIPVKNALGAIHGHTLHIQSVFEEVAVTQDVEIMSETAHHAMEITNQITIIEDALPDTPGAKEIRGLFEKYYRNATKLAEQLVDTSMADLMKEMNEVSFYREHLDEHMHNLESYLENEYQSNAANAQQQMQQLTWILFAMIFALTGILTIGSFFIMRNLSQRLSVLTRFAEQVQQGDYDNTVDANWNDEFSIVVNAFNKMVESVKVSTDKLNRLANYDSLTEVYSRNALLDKIEAEIRSVKRHKYPLSFCMCDVDQFKTVNDTYGHETGDMILREFAKCIKKKLRMEDIIGRYGGDEFSIIFPHTTAEAATVALERIRECLSSQAFKDHKGNEFSVSCSFGVTDFHPEMDQTILIRIADEALYESKQKGRNCVTVKQWDR